MKLTGTVVIPLASPDDASTTARAAAPYLGTADKVVLTYVVEKGGGAPDKASLEQMEGYAEKVFDAAREELADAETEVETRVLYGTSISKTVFDLCDEVGASSVALVPRESNRLFKLLVGDRVRPFIEDNDIPVVVFPSDD